MDGPNIEDFADAQNIVFDRMLAAKKKYDEQMQAVDTKNKLIAVALRHKTPEIETAIGELEKDSALRKYIHQLEVINSQIWCDGCDKLMSISDKMKEEIGPAEVETEVKTTEAEYQAQSASDDEEPDISAKLLAAVEAMARAESGCGSGEICRPVCRCIEDKELSVKVDEALQERLERIAATKAGDKAKSALEKIMDSIGEDEIRQRAMAMGFKENPRDLVVSDESEGDSGDERTSVKLYDHLDERLRKVEEIVFRAANEAYRTYGSARIAAKEEGRRR